MPLVAVAAGKARAAAAPMPGSDSPCLGGIQRLARQDELKKGSNMMTTKINGISKNHGVLPPTNLETDKNDQRPNHQRHDRGRRTLTRGVYLSALQIPSAPAAKRFNRSKSAVNCDWRAAFGQVIVFMSLS
jgi:hypothetical protein